MLRVAVVKAGIRQFEANLLSAFIDEVVDLFGFEQVADGALQILILLVLGDHLPYHVVCLLEHVQKFELDSLVAHAFEELEGALQGLHGYRDICV